MTGEPRVSEWLRDGRMVYKLTPDGINEFEIAVSSANRRLDRAGLIALAEQIRCLPDLMIERDSLAQRVRDLENLLRTAPFGYSEHKKWYQRVEGALAGSEEGK